MAKTKVKAKAPVFPKSDLIANASYFGVMPETVAGALHDKDEATVEEAKVLIQAFLEKPKGA